MNPGIDNEMSPRSMRGEIGEESSGPLATVSGRFATGSAPPGSTLNVPVAVHLEAGGVADREAPNATTIAKAIAVLAALGGGQDPTERGRALADEILGREEVRLALEIRAGRDMALRRSLELAALVLAAAHGGARR